MGLRLRRRGARRDVAEVKAKVAAQPEMFVGTTVLPEEGDSQRISSAADVDPNYKKYGTIGLPGGAGGFGGAGT